MMLFLLLHVLVCSFYLGQCYPAADGYNDDFGYYSYGDDLRDLWLSPSRGFVFMNGQRGRSVSAPPIPISPFVRSNHQTSTRHQGSRFAYVPNYFLMNQPRRSIQQQTTQGKKSLNGAEPSIDSLRQRHLQWKKEIMANNMNGRTTVAPIPLRTNLGLPNLIPQHHTTGAHKNHKSQSQTGKTPPLPSTDRRTKLAYNNNTIQIRQRNNRPSTLKQPSSFAPNSGSNHVGSVQISLSRPKETLITKSHKPLISSHLQPPYIARSEIITTETLTKNPKNSMQKLRSSTIPHNHRIRQPISDSVIPVKINRNSTIKSTLIPRRNPVTHESINQTNINSNPVDLKDTRTKPIRKIIVSSTERSMPLTRSPEQLQRPKMTIYPFNKRISSKKDIISQEPPIRIRVPFTESKSNNNSVSKISQISSDDNSNFTTVTNKQTNNKTSNNITEKVIIPNENINGPLMNSLPEFKSSVTQLSKPPNTITPKTSSMRRNPPPSRHMNKFTNITIPQTTKISATMMSTGMTKPKVSSMTTTIKPFSIVPHGIVPKYDEMSKPNTSSIHSQINLSNVEPNTDKVSRRGSQALVGVNASKPLIKINVTSETINQTAPRNTLNNLSFARPNVPPSTIVNASNRSLKQNYNRNININTPSNLKSPVGIVDGKITPRSTMQPINLPNRFVQKLNITTKTNNTKSVIQHKEIENSERHFHENTEEVKYYNSSTNKSLEELLNNSLKHENLKGSHNNIPTETLKKNGDNNLNPDENITIGNDVYEKSLSLGNTKTKVVVNNTKVDLRNTALKPNEIPIYVTVTTKEGRKIRVPAIFTPKANITVKNSVKNEANVISTIRPAILTTTVIPSTTSMPPTTTISSSSVKYFSTTKYSITKQEIQAPLQEDIDTNFLQKVENTQMPILQNLTETNDVPPFLQDIISKIDQSMAELLRETVIEYMTKDNKTNFTDNVETNANLKNKVTTSPTTIRQSYLVRTSPRIRTTTEASGLSPVIDELVSQITKGANRVRDEISFLAEDSANSLMQDIEDASDKISDVTATSYRGALQTRDTMSRLMSNVIRNLGNFVSEAVQDTVKTAFSTAQSVGQFVNDMNVNAVDGMLKQGESMRNLFSETIEEIGAAADKTENVMSRVMERNNRIMTS